MEQRARRGWVRPAIRAACMVLAAVSLAGCVVYPAGYYRPYYRPYYHYYY